MRYNPYMRHRRLNSSIEQRTISNTEITRRAAEYLYKNFKIGAADFASFTCKIYSTNQPVDFTATRQKPITIYSASMR